YSALFTPDGKFIVSTGADGQIKMWNPVDGAIVRQFVDPAITASPGQPPPDKAQRDWINQIRLSPDGQKLASVGNAGWLCLWNMADGKLLFQQRMPTPLYSVSFSHDGKLLVTGNYNGTATVLKLPGM